LKVVERIRLSLHVGEVTVDNTVECDTGYAASRACKQNKNHKLTTKQDCKQQEYLLLFLLFL